MWTEAHRARHEARLNGMVTMSAAGEIARWLEQADSPHSGWRTPLHRVVAALVGHPRVGGAWWWALPAGFPPWRTVCGWFRCWLERGLVDALPGGGVARLRRRAAGRQAEPSLRIIDAQAVTCIGVRGPRGYDAGKKVLGRKRVALVDAEGHLLAVVAASAQDRDALPALDRGEARWPSLRGAFRDSAFAAERCREWADFHGRRRRLAARDPAAKGCAVIARRSVVERTLGWLAHWNGLARATALDASPSSPASERCPTP